MVCMSVCMSGVYECVYECVHEGEEKVTAFVLNTFLLVHSVQHLKKYFGNFNLNHTQAL